MYRSDSATDGSRVMPASALVSTSAGVGNGLHRQRRHVFCLAGMLLCTGLPSLAAADVAAVELGPRPFYLVDRLADGELKDRLAACAADKASYEPSAFSIGHRGAALQFPEHSRESYMAAARMGAGIIECDVTFTRDAELVCRHAQCDLHTTTNILATPLAEKCTEPFSPATFTESGELDTPASARCCASDLTLEEFRSLEAKMDAADSRATTVEAYIAGSTPFRTDLYATGGTVLTHAESIELIGSLGAGFTPELKESTDGFGDTGLDQQSYAQKMLQEYIDAGVDASQVWPQSFNLDDIRYWLKQYPEFAQQAVYLDGRTPEDIAEEMPPVDEFAALHDEGLRIIAPPMPLLLEVDEQGDLAPSQYAQNVRSADLNIIAWSLERSGRIAEDVVPADGAFYYDTTVSALQNDGDILKTLDVLARQVGIIGMFSDWPATTTFYANCVDLPQ